MTRENHSDARGPDSTNTGGDTENTPTVTRRGAIKATGAAACGGVLGMAATGSAAAGGGTKTWMTDDVPETPLYKLSLPGTHHSGMFNGGPDWWFAQNNDVYTQLKDGIRFLDFRVGSYDDWGTTKFRHHHAGGRPQPHKWGAEFDGEIFPDVRRYLREVDDQGGSECIVMSFFEFWDSGWFSDDEFESWDEFEGLLQDQFGEYVLDLGEYSSSELLELTPSDLDGPRVAVLYRDTDRRPSWAGDDSTYVDIFANPGGTPGTVLAESAQQSYRSTSRFGRLEWQIAADGAEGIVEGWLGIESQFGDLYEAALRTNTLLGGYVNAVKRDPGLNPNIISLDYYETSNVVEYCRELSRAGLHSGVIDDSPPVAEGTHVLESVDTGMVADVSGASEDDGANVHVWGRHGGDNQRFAFTQNDDHSYRITAEHSGKVLDVSGAGTENGDNIHQWESHGGDNQRWYVADADGREGYILVNKNSGRVFDASSDEEGSTIHQWGLHNRDNQRWRIE